MWILIAELLFASLLAAQGASGPAAAAPPPPAVPAPHDTRPIYRVEVVQRTVQAVNYGHRAEPTKVDLKGTVLAPEARGEAKVESQRGAVEIDARMERLKDPSTYGREYLTYVLWAITPEGRPSNLGEVVLDSSNKAHVKVSAPFQAFALIVTAEPYFAVTRPSDVVVMENVIRPDTIGKVEEVTAKYELLPRGRYTYTEPTPGVSPLAGAPKVSMDQYEAIAALYQALNAIQIARAAGADQQAADTMQKATQLYENAREMQAKGDQSRQVVTLARQAAQTAEDARAIAARHGEH